MQREDASVYLLSLSSDLRQAGAAETADLVEHAASQLQMAHWFELSQALLKAIQDPLVLGRAYELHDSVLRAVRTDLSPVAYVKLVYYTCFSPESSLSKAMPLVEGACAMLLGQNEVQANYAAQCIRALLFLEEESTSDTKALSAQPGSGPYTARKVLEEVEHYLEGLQQHEVEPVVVALHSKARGRDFEVRQMYTRYYENVFDIVNYSQKADMIILEPELNSLAFKAAVAALLSEEIFNFGKLLNFAPFVSHLSGHGADGWVLEMLTICNEGSVGRFEAFYTSHKAQLASVPDLVGAADELRKKVRLMALLHLVFYTPFNERTFPFATVAQRCEVSDSEVEPLLLAALAQGIVKGKIDGLEKNVHISWVQPRVLNRDEVRELAQHVGKWKEQVLAVSKTVGEQTSLIST